MHVLANSNVVPKTTGSRYHHDEIHHVSLRPAGPLTSLHKFLQGQQVHPAAKTAPPEQSEDVWYCSPPRPGPPPGPGFSHTTLTYILLGQTAVQSGEPHQLHWQHQHSTQPSAASARLARPQQRLRLGQHAPECCHLPVVLLQPCSCVNCLLPVSAPAVCGLAVPLRHPPVSPKPFQSQQGRHSMGLALHQLPYNGCSTLS